MKCFKFLVQIQTPEVEAYKMSPKRLKLIKREIEEAAAFGCFNTILFERLEVTVVEEEAADE